MCQYQVLVTCIFLNKTYAVSARPYLEDFLEEYPTPRSLQDADPKTIASVYFKRLGLYRRAWWLVEMAHQLLTDPPQPNVLRRKSGPNAGLWSEVSHLAGVGEYASDAWRLFCKQKFYARYGISVADEWRTLQPVDKELKKYVKRKKLEERSRVIEEDLARRLMATRL